MIMTSSTLFTITCKKLFIIINLFFQMFENYIGGGLSSLSSLFTITCKKLIHTFFLDFLKTMDNRLGHLWIWNCQKSLSQLFFNIKQWIAFFEWERTIGGTHRVEWSTYFHLNVHILSHDYWENCPWIHTRTCTCVYNSLRACISCICFQMHLAWNALTTRIQCTYMKCTACV